MSSPNIDRCTSRVTEFNSNVLGTVTSRILSWKQWWRLIVMDDCQRIKNRESSAAIRRSNQIYNQNDRVYWNVLGTITSRILPWKQWRRLIIMHDCQRIKNRESSTAIQRRNQVLPDLQPKWPKLIEMYWEQSPPNFFMETILER